MMHGVAAYVELSKSVTYKVPFQLGCSRQLTASLGYGTELVSPVRGKKDSMSLCMLFYTDSKQTETKEVVYGTHS